MTEAESFNEKSEEANVLQPWVRPEIRTFEAGEAEAAGGAGGDAAIFS